LIWFFGDKKMRKESSYFPASKKLLLQSAVALLLFLFIGNTLKTQLSGLESSRHSCQLCDHLVGEEVPLDDAESQKKEKKKGFEEFIPSIKPSIVTLIRIAPSPSFIYNQSFKSRMSDMISPPPKIA
jgi:hypothetical protein